ncbi:MAG: hypothetical protein JXA44_08805 [Methanospirillaceae archaeon]|nr:hypothetical protein [Methanospirillaceae archaeon]
MKAAQKRGPGNLFSDYSIITLLAANVLTIIIALLEQWDLGQTLFIYWVQSLIIGIFAAARILLYKTEFITNSPDFQEFIREKESKNPKRTARAIKTFMAGFFSFHYGLFHFGYLEFLSDFGLLGSVSIIDPYFLLACTGFILHHGYSFFYHQNFSTGAKEFLQETFFFPYYRIIPMHGTIIVGGFISIIAMIFSVDLSMVILGFFLGIKTVVDIVVHRRKHEKEGDNIPDIF